MANNGNVMSALIMLQFTMLAAEFLLGMYLNLFTSTPFPISMGPGSRSYALSLAPHMAIGAVIFVLSVVIAYLSYRRGERIITIASSLGLVFVLIAGVSGYVFAFVTGQDIMSFLMATTFLLALIFYTVPVSRVLGRSTRTS